MASFTDSVIPQFNPYIQQLPVEAMVSVGMDKQRRYEAGYQRIQSQIDQVAGMSVLRPVDKQYMQSKLNELGNNLKGVAAADFSNFQLVNSVGGMVGQLAKDKRIQSAVYSTKKAQDELKKAQDLYDDGKSSINNLNDIKEQVGEYAMSTDPESQFNGRYVNYIDLNKKFQDLADNLKKNAPSVGKDNPYKTDAAGNTLYYKKVVAKDDSGKPITKIEASTNANSGGVPELDDAMKRITIKGVSAQDMYDAIKNSLTEDDLAQMRIDAKAEYRGKGPESILSLYTEANRLATDSMKDGIGRLKVFLTNPKLTSAEREEIEARIGSLESKLSTNNSDYENGMRNLATSLSNPATLKNAQFEVYKKTKLNQTAISLSNRSYEEELRANPYEEANHRRLVLQNQIINANRDYNLRAAQFAETKQQHAWEKYKWSEEKIIRAAELEDKNPSPNVRDRAISTDVTTPAIGDVENSISKVSATLNTLHTDYGTKLNMSKGALDKQYEQYLKDPQSTTKMNNDLVDYITLRHEQEKLLIKNNNIKKSVEKVNQQYDAKLDRELEGVEGLGTLLSANDLYKVRSSFFNSMSTQYTGGNSPFNALADVKLSIPAGTKIAFNEAAFLKNIGSNPQKQAIAKALIKNWNGESLTPMEKNIVDKSKYLYNAYNPKLEQIVKEGNVAVGKEIMKYDSKYQQQVATLRNENTRDMNEARNIVGDMITKINTGEPISLPSGKKVSVEDLTKVQEGIGKSATVAIVKNNDGSATLEVQVDGSTQSIPMSSEEFSERFPKYAKVNPLTEAYRSLNASPFKTTNIGGGAGDKSSDAVNAAFWGFQAQLLNGTDYANRVRFDIIGRKENSGDANNDRFGLRIFVQKPNGSWIVDDNKGGWQSSAAVEEFINRSLGIATIEDILNRNK